MLVRIRFPQYSDLSDENREMVESSCMTMDELRLSAWRGRTLIYWTRNSPRDVIDMWENAGYHNLDEMDLVEFRN